MLSAKEFASEAARALINYTKTEIKISHFLAHCDTENIASYKVMEKLGMSKTGEWGGRRNKSASKDSLEYQYELYLTILFASIITIPYYPDSVRYKGTF